MTDKLGQMLLKAGLISQDQLRKGLEAQKEKGGRLGFNLIRLGIVRESDITQLLSKQYGVPFINLRYVEIDESVIDLIPAEVAHKHLVVPLSRTGATLTIAMADPTNVFAMEDVKVLTGCNVEPVVASEIAVLEAIEEYYGAGGGLDTGAVGTAKNARDVESPEEEEDEEDDEDSDEEEKAEEEEEAEEAEEDDEEEEGDAEEVDIEEEAAVEETADVRGLEQAADDPRVVNLVKVILTGSIKKDASDIHIEPYEKDFRIRYRIDGALHDIMHPPLKLREAIIRRVKLMAKLDFETRLPQDGRIKATMKFLGKNKGMDYRVSVLPTLFGEKIVLRRLDQDNFALDLTHLGFDPEPLAKFEKAILKPHGLVLVTGPARSGKTNTLYASIRDVNTPEMNILSAEDPIELTLDGINQIPMNEQIGLNFATAVRSFLKHDPDIILIGEIPDLETAEIAMKAAMTSCLVLSTLHTNDAPSAISRLLHMGVEPFLASSSITLICAQHLVRRICKACRQEIHLPVQTLVDAGFSADEAPRLKLYKGRGCARCNKTGYRGRVGLFEVMEVSDEIRELIHAGASTPEIRRKALEQGMVSLRAAGLNKLREGLTTIEEVQRETVA